MLTYQNDKKFKKEMVSEMVWHRKQDNLIKGTYAKNGKFCAVGCGVESLNRRKGLEIKHDDHAAYAKALGIPEWLARLEDTLFENLPSEESKEFPVKFLRAIPVGVDLEPVKWRFCAFILKENIERVLALKDISEDLKKQVVDAIRGCLALHEQAVKSGNWDESAAESAAWSARSAAWSARSAAYSRYAKELLRLLRSAK